MKQIRITIRPDGTQKVEALGCTGASCEELTRTLEKRLGTPEGGRTLKEEYHLAEQEAEQTHEREGGA